MNVEFNQNVIQPLILIVLTVIAKYVSSMSFNIGWLIDTAKDHEQRLRSGKL